MAKTLPVLLLFLLPVTVFAQNVYKSRDTSNFTPDTVQQKDVIDILRAVFKIDRNKPRQPDPVEKKFYFSILPVSSSVDGPGKALITSTTVGFYLGLKATTNISSISFTPYFNFTGRYGLPVRSSIWLNNNTWLIQGDTRFLVYPTYTWGLNSNQPESDKFLLNYKYFRFYQSALKQITPYFFAGLGYDFDSYVDLDIISNNNAAFRDYTGYKYGTTADGSFFSSGPTFNVLYDTRNNSLNPVPGFYTNVIYRLSTVPFGSNNNWQSLYIDLRKYVSVTNSGPKNILAFWSYFWTSLTPGTPYLDLPSIGMDPGQRSGRGIEQSRYRGQRLFYAEAEYRRDITANGLLGFVVFSNINSTTQPHSNRFQYWHPAAGTGLRIKFNKKSNTNIALDYGFSKNYQGVYVNLGEAF
jgi:hypothetical protein